LNGGDEAWKAPGFVVAVRSKEPNGFGRPYWQTARAQIGFGWRAGDVDRRAPKAQGEVGRGSDGAPRRNSGGGRPGGVLSCSVWRELAQGGEHVAGIAAGEAMNDQAAVAVRDAKRWSKIAASLAVAAHGAST
jgi:hypothetical protein